MTHIFGRLVMVAAVTSSLRHVPPTTIASPPQVRAARPFVAGERAVYDIKYTFLSPGSASLEVVGIDTVRDKKAYRFRLTINGGIPFYRIRDTMQSWVDTSSFRALRFHTDQDEGGKNRVKRYEIFPERNTYRDGTKPEVPSVPDPLDDISFLYYVRSLDLKVDSTYTFDRYFKPESNPVKLVVLGRETIEVPAGKFKTIKVQPIIKTKGIFSQGGHALVWLSDDSARIVVKIQTRLPVASIALELKSYRAGPAVIKPRTP